MLKGYPIKITKKNINSYDGKLFIGENSLYFFPNSKENALKVALKRGLLKSLFGFFISTNHIEEIEHSDIADELSIDDLESNFKTHPEAMKFEANKIDKIRHDWSMRVIKYDGKSYGLADGISKELREALKPWATKNRVETQGF